MGSAVGLKFIMKEKTDKVQPKETELRKVVHRSVLPEVLRVSQMLDFVLVPCATVWIYRKGLLLLSMNDHMD